MYRMNMFQYSVYITKCVSIHVQMKIHVQKCGHLHVFVLKKWSCRQTFMHRPFYVAKDADWLKITWTLMHFRVHVHFHVRTSKVWINIREAYIDTNVHWKIHSDWGKIGWDINFFHSEPFWAHCAVVAVVLPVCILSIVSVPLVWICTAWSCSGCVCPVWSCSRRRETSAWEHRCHVSLCTL